MKIKLAALIDGSIGRLLLFFLSFLPPYPKKIPIGLSLPEYSKNILVMKFWGMGTIIESTPLLRVLKEKYPALPMDILTFSENKQIVEQLGFFRNIHVITIKKGILSFLMQTVKFIATNAGRYSILFDLEFFASFSALINKMLFSRYSLGFDSLSNSRNRCYSCAIVFDHSTHVRIIFLKFLNALNIGNATDINLSKINIPEDKKVSAITKLPFIKDGGTKIAININTSELCLNRRWPIEKFYKLITLIRQEFNDMQIYLVGDKGDINIVRSLYDSLPDKRKIYITAGLLDILEFSYILSKMNLFITNDGGPMHVAEAMRIPVFCFFGPETPNLYGPLSVNSEVFYSNIYCSPCLNTYNHKRSKCKDNQCLKIIEVGDVFRRFKHKFEYGNTKISDDNPLSYRKVYKDIHG